MARAGLLAAEYFYATPTIAYGRVFIGNTDGTVYAFGAEAGTSLGRRTPGRTSTRQPRSGTGRVYVGSYDGNFYALDAATGIFAGRRSAGGDPRRTDGRGRARVLRDLRDVRIRGVTLQEAGGRATYALDARTGSSCGSPDGHYSPIVADEERVYLTGSGSVLGLEPCRRGQPGCS